MGCLCSKCISANDHPVKCAREKELNVSLKQSAAPSLTSEGAAVEENNGGLDATVHLISKQPVEENGGPSPPKLWSDREKDEVVKKAIMPQPLKQEAVDGASGVGVSGRQPQLPSVLSFSHGVQGAQISAGWPSWLTAVAGEAIKGWLPRKADSFEKLDKIGQGTYSSVYRGRDLETGKLVAMKKVRFINMDPESVRFMAREIHILRRLDHSNVMKLEGLITSRMSSSLYLIFEYMDHDLAGLAATPGIKFTEPQIKCYMQQLLCGLEYCHSQGVLHRDIKGSNLLIDNNGNLKIGDFGLATFFHANQRQPLTSRVVTLWYRPPELLLGATDYGVGVDLWSAGCILAELFSGKPIMPGRTEVEQLHKIFKLCGSPSEEYWRKSKLPHATIFKPQNPYRRCVAETFEDFPSSALSLLDVLLAVEPEGRGSASSALQSEFFSMKPLPCSPSSLPKYSPSKEFDAKLRNEEARRKKNAVSKERNDELSRIGHGESETGPALDDNPLLMMPVQRCHGQSNPKISTERCNPEPSGVVNVKEDEALMGPHRTSDYAGDDTENQRAYSNNKAIELSRFSNSVAPRNSLREMRSNSHWGLKGHSNAGYNQLEGLGSSRKHDWFHRLLDRPKSAHKKEGRAVGKESTMGYGSKNNRIHYSGPLLPPGGNLEEALKVHERRIQNAVRKARLDKSKVKNTFTDNGQAKSLLRHG